MEIFTTVRVFSSLFIESFYRIYASLRPQAKCIQVPVPDSMSASGSNLVLYSTVACPETEPQSTKSLQTPPSKIHFVPRVPLAKSIIPIIVVVVAYSSVTFVQLFLSATVILTPVTNEFKTPISTA